MIFGLGSLPLIVLGTLFAMVAMIMATLAGLDRIPRVLLKTARMHRLSPVEETLAHPPAGRRAASVLRAEARRRLFLHRRHRRRVHPVDHGLGHEIAFAYDNFDNPRCTG